MPKKKKDFEDSIVGDVRRARAKLLAKFGNDVGRLCEYLMEEQAKYPGRVMDPGSNPTFAVGCHFGAGAEYFASESRGFCVMRVPEAM